MSDVSADLPAAVARRRVAALQQLTVDLATARTPQEACCIACRHATAAMGAAGAACWYVDGRAGTRLGVTSGVLGGRDLPLPDLAAFAQDGGGLWTTPELSAALRAEPGEIARTATLTAGGVVVGALALTLDDRSVTGQDPGLLATIVRTAGEVLGRAVRMADSLRLTAIVESSPDLMVRMDLDGTVRSWNPGAERIFGYAAAEVVGRHSGLLAQGGQLDEPTRAALERLRRGDGVQQVVVPRRRKDGTPVTMAVTFSPVLDEHGAIDGIAVTGRDITERIDAQDRIRRLGAALDAAPFAVVIADEDGRVVECSSRARTLLGLVPAAVLGGDVRDAAQVPPEVGVPLAAALDGRSTTGLELRGRDADQRALHVQGSAFPVRLDNGTTTAGVFLGADVTESATMAEALRQARMLEALGRLAGGVAHDVNNVLAVVDGYSRIARRQVTDDPEARDAIDQVLGATTRLQRLTRRLLAFSRRRPAEPEPLDLRAAVAELVPMLRALAGAGVDLRTDLSPAPVPVVADLAAIEQVVLNLVLNARDAMPEGGPVTVLLREEGDVARLEVADAGEGMPEEVAARVFDPFFSTKRDRQDQGTGLGLSTVHAAVTEAGGTISLDSAPGRGTRVTVCFPLAVAVEPPAAAPSARPATGDHVLLVDDEPALLRLATHVLERAGYRVTAAGTVTEADAVLADDVDVLVTDVRLPGGSGLDLVARVPPEVGVVLMSGAEPESGAPDRGLFLDKPFTPESLTRAVQAALERRPPPAARP